MAVELILDDGPPNADVTSFAIVEDSTPTNVADSSGGVGQLSIVVDEQPGSAQWVNKLATLVVDSDTLISGKVTSVGGDEVLATVTSDSVLGLLNAPRRVKPYSGTLGGAITYYMGLVGIHDIQVDASITGRPVTVIGWFGNLWTKLKEFAAVQKIEFATSGETVLVQPLRTHTMVVDGRVSVGWQNGNQTLAQTVEVFEYGTRYRTNALIYPPGTYDDDTGRSTPAGWTSDAEIIQVGAYESIQFEVPVNASLSSVQQPVCVEEVTRDYDDSSVYTVVGQDGVETLDPAVWTARGGKVSVAIGEDTTSIIVTVSSGWNEPSLAPFRIAMTSGNDYSTLRIVGTGVFMSKTKHTIPTGVPDTLTSLVVGTTVDSPFVGSLEQMYDVAAEAVVPFSAPVKTLTGTGDNPGLPVGAIAGARIEQPDAFYRVRSATTNQDGLSYTADADTLFSDFEDRWGDTATFADFNAVSLEKGWTFRDLASSPLPVKIL